MKKKVIAPKGFHFRIFKEPVDKKYPRIVTVSLYVKGKINRKIGYINLYKGWDKTYTTHSYLEDKYHGKGLGVLLYAKSIQWCLDNGCRARSSGASSKKAQRVWKSKGLRKFFNIKTYKSRISSEYDTWHAYAKK
jgi:GNAT superfamily N-acetyltransferase